MKINYINMKKKKTAAPDTTAAPYTTDALATTPAPAITPFAAATVKEKNLGKKQREQQKIAKKKDGIKEVKKNLGIKQRRKIQSAMASADKVTAE